MKRATYSLAIVMVIFTITVATHEGEFWPFSIYPMFSQAGNPWNRALLVRLDNEEITQFDWKTVHADSLPGNVVALADIGADNIDFANFVGKTKDWSPDRVAALRTFLGMTVATDEAYVAYRIHGRRNEIGEVELMSHPVAMFTAGENKSGVSP
jgi:endo-1,4-beta-D-glucanase Y